MQITPLGGFLFCGIFSHRILSYGVPGQFWLANIVVIIIDEIWGLRWSYLLIEKCWGYLSKIVTLNLAIKIIQKWLVFSMFQKCAVLSNLNSKARAFIKGPFICSPKHFFFPLSPGIWWRLSSDSLYLCVIFNMWVNLGEKYLKVPALLVILRFLFLMDLGHIHISSLPF